jgi:N-acetylneuraminate synthase
MKKIETIKIGNIKVGPDHPCYIIAEIGSNFDGSLQKAKKLIKLAKDCGANAVKFQSFKTDLLLSKNGFDKKNAFQAKWKKSVWKTYQDAEFPRKWHKILNDFSKKNSIQFFTSPWDFEAVELLKELDVPVIKIGSGDITYFEMLKRVGKTGKPIILATGASNMKEVEDAVKIIKSTGNKKIILLHSVVQYPSPIQEANLNALETLRKKFNLNVGYSDHSPGSLIVLSSVVLGAKIIEKHFTIDPKSMGPDHPHSMDPKSFKKMIDNIRTIEKSMGDGKKNPVHSENETRIIQRRGIWTVNGIKKGEKISEENIKALRPFSGISASKYEKIIGKKATRNLKAHYALKENDFK